MTNTDEVKAEAKRLAGLYMAIAEGRTLQYLFGTTVEGAGSWCDVACLSVNDILYIASTQIKIRIKPEPQLVPWTSSSAPVGAVVRSKKCPNARVLIQAGPDLAEIGNDTRYGYQLLAEQCEWKWPHEPDSTWRACGNYIGEES